MNNYRYFEKVTYKDGEPYKSEWFVVERGRKQPYCVVAAERGACYWLLQKNVYHSPLPRRFFNPTEYHNATDVADLSNVEAHGCLFCEELIYRKMRCPIELEQFKVEDGFCFLSQMRLLEQTSSGERVCYSLLFRDDLGLYRTNSVYVGEYWSRSYSMGWAVSGRSFPYVDRTFGCEADAIYQLDRMLGKVVLRQFGRVERLPTTGYHNRIEVYE